MESERLYRDDLMTKQEKAYYYEMFKRGRLFPYADSKGFLYGFLTFWIMNGWFKSKDPWELIEDNPNGAKCYIEQVFFHPDYRLTGKIKEWSRFKQYIRETFPNVERFAWVRHKNNRLFSYQGGEQCLIR